MKRVIRAAASAVLTVSLMGTVVSAAAADTPTSIPKGVTTDDAATLGLVYAAMHSRVLAQQIAKDYLYIGQDIALSETRQEMQASLHQLDQAQSILKKPFIDPKIKKLLTLAQKNIDAIKDTVQKPYSVNNAQKLTDLADAISAGGKTIALMLKKKLSQDYPAGNELRYLTVRMAKDYMAYAAGIQGDKMIQQMQQSVSSFDTLLTKIKVYPRNTPSMEQLLNDTDKLWTIVKPLYLDIKESDLALIVYQTSEAIDQNMMHYARLAKELATQK